MKNIIEGEKMKHIKLLALSIATLWTVTGCCWTDHSKMIKEVAEPMAKHLEQFYKKEKRFPTIEERNRMLEKVGCEVHGNVCTYKLKDISLKERTVTNYYDLIMMHQNTYCPLYLKSNATVDKIGCLQKPCIDMGQ